MISWNGGYPWNKSMWFHVNNSCLHQNYMYIESGLVISTIHTLKGKTEEMAILPCQYILKLQKIMWWNGIIVENEGALRENYSNLLSSSRRRIWSRKCKWLSGEPMAVANLGPDTWPSLLKSDRLPYLGKWFKTAVPSSIFSQYLINPF